VLDDGTTADIDVLSQNRLGFNFDHTGEGRSPFSEFATVGFHRTPDHRCLDRYLTGHITFAPLKPPASGSTVTIPYILEFIPGSIGVQLSAAANLTITFATKRYRSAATRSSAGPITITAVFRSPLPDQFVFNLPIPPPDAGHVNKTLTYVLRST